MRMTFKSILISALIAVFTAGSIMCCCIRHLTEVKGAIKSCCQAKADKGSASKTACKGCDSVLKSAESTQIFDLTFSLKPVVHPSFVIAYRLPLTANNFSQWINGPPGPVSTVPLYTQFHTLRI